MLAGNLRRPCASGVRVGAGVAARGADGEPRQKANTTGGGAAGTRMLTSTGDKEDKEDK